MKFSQTKFSAFSLLIALLIVVWVAANLNFGKDNWKGILESDAKGYYAYLPAVFIYHDLNFGFLEQVQAKYPAPHLDYDYRANAHNVLINKYYVGTAIMELPFFAAAHFITYLTQGDLDGYSKWYLIAVNIAALFYLGLGLYYLRKTLQWFKFSDKWIALLILACLFASNLFVYAVVEPGMSHVFSFCLISFFVYSIIRLKQDFSAKRLFCLALTLGLIATVRPVNLLVVFAIPFLLGGLNNLKSLLLKLIEPKNLLRLLSFFCFPFIQLLYYKLASGNWLVYSYDQETFDFSNPHFFDILFSYKKGLFLYTPIYLLAFSGLFFLWKKSRFRFITWLAFFCLLTYIFSSWWMWFYGGSFSSRVYVEYLPLFMILLGFAFQNTKIIWKKYALTSMVIMLIALCQVQSYQYRYYIIHYSEMTKEKYWENFLKIEKN